MPQASPSEATSLQLVRAPLGFRDAGLQVRHPVLGEWGDGWSSGHTELPARSGLFHFLNSKCMFQLAIRPACGVFWDWKRLCFTDSEGPSRPLLPLHTVPASSSEQAASCCFSLCRRGRGWGDGEQRGRAEGRLLLRGPTDCSLTPHLWPHQMPLRSSPASPRSLPGGHPLVLSPARVEDQTFHRGPAFQTTF